MVGCQLLNLINRRLQQAFNSSLDFGGVVPIFVGDMFQIQPIGDSWIFKSPGGVYSSLARNLWVEKVKMYELDQIMRQEDDQEFAQLLNRLREGNHNAEDKRKLEARFLKNGCFHIDDYWPHLYSTRDKTKEHNNTCYGKMKTEKKII